MDNFVPLKRGRRSKYRPEMDGKAKKALSEGLSMASAAASCGIDLTTLYEWCDEYHTAYKPDFAQAVSEGRDQGIVFWDRKARDAAIRKTGGNVNALIFNLKNRIGWRDRTEVTGTVSNPVRMIEVTTTEQLPEETQKETIDTTVTVMEEQRTED